MVSLDHCPILLYTLGSSLLHTRSFRFEDFWTRDPSCHYVIAKALSSINSTTRSSDSRFQKKKISHSESFQNLEQAIFWIY